MRIDAENWKLLAANNLHFGTLLTQSQFHFVVKCLSIRSTSEGWKRNAVGQTAQSVKYLTCLPWTVSGFFSDHTTLLPIFTGWGVPAALDTAQHSFPEKIEKGWHTAMLPLSLSFSVEKLKEKLGRKKKLASTTVQITKLCHCLGGWNSPSRQRGAPRAGHRFIRGPTYGAQTHTYWQFRLTY